MPIGVFRARGGVWGPNPVTNEPGSRYPQAFNACRHGIARIEEYEQFIGRQVDYVCDYLVDEPASWREFEQGYVVGVSQSPANSLAAYSGRLEVGHHPVIAIPACCLGTSWADEASGVNDAHWKNLGTWLVDNGLANAVLRIAREFNGNWYRWSIRACGANKMSNYVAGYEHLVAVLRAVPGQRFRFEWNPTSGQFYSWCNPVRPGVNAPGATFIDEVGVDLYDFDAWSTTESWLGFWLSAARSVGKPLAFPEWGLNYTSAANGYPTPNDDPTFIHNMANFLATNDISWHAFFEGRDYGVADGDTDYYEDRSYGRCASCCGSYPVPNSRRAFLASLCRF